MNVLEELRSCIGFQWDEGNLVKNWDKHHVTDAECEDVFFNRPLLTTDDREHSAEERRLYALGTTDAGRHLFVAFTIRGPLIRVISARDMTRKEHAAYAGAKP
jgi:uncharacterized DUF497 family protein